MDDQSKTSSDLPDKNSHSRFSDGSKSHEQEKETGNSDKAGACTVNQDNDNENNPGVRQRATVPTDKSPENDQNLPRSNISQQASSPNSSINNSANTRDQRTTGDYLSTGQRQAQPAAMHPVVNNDMTENIHRFQIRCVLFLCLAVGIGYLYLQLENQSMLGKPRLFPGPNYAAFEGKSLKQNSHNKIKSSPTPAPPPIPKSTPTEDDLPQPIATDFSKQPPQKPMIDPNYEIQAKYLSKVLTTLGDLSRKMEPNDNITKPIGGIIEMRTEVVEPEEKEEVPEYLKRLGSIIDDIKVKKEKDRAVRKEEQIKANLAQAAKKSKLEIENDRIKKSKRKEKLKLKREKERKQEWDKFMDDLLEAVYEEEQAERKARGEKEPQQFNSRSRADLDNMDDMDDEDDDEEYDDDDDDDIDDVVIDLRSETEKNKKSRSEQPKKLGLGDLDFETRQHYMRIRHNMGYGLRGNSRLDEMDEVDTEDEEVDEDLDDELYQELEDEEADEPPSIFANNKEIQGGMALLQIMLAAKNEAKAAKQAEEEKFDKKSSKSNAGYDTEKNSNSARRPKSKFEDDNNMFTL